MGGPAAGRIADAEAGARLPFFCGFGGLDAIFWSSTGSTRNLILMEVADFSITEASKWLGDDFGRSDLDTRGLVGASDFLSWPFVSGTVRSISILSLAIAIWGAAPESLEVLSFSLFLLLTGDFGTSRSKEEVFRFRSSRDPSIGSSGAISWLNTE